MADFEQRTEEYGTTILKLIRVKEVIAGSVRIFGNIILSMRHFRENDLEMMSVKIIPLVGAGKLANSALNTITNDKLSLNKFTATVNHRTNIIEFGPTQGAYVEEGLRGRGIGSFAFNELVNWIKVNFQEYTVNSFDIMMVDSLSQEEKDRRNKFLENFGFTVNYTDATQKSGSMKVKKPALMKEHYNSEKIDELDIEQFVFGVISEKNKLEKDFYDLKIEHEARGEEIMGGIPKADIVKYTLIGSALVLIMMILLII